uniref:Uncharacterized protein n=1 Tax=Arundo donax TaxID=35708 RepID=A0A0A9BIS2_ARUDO
MNKNGCLDINIRCPCEKINQSILNSILNSKCENITRRSTTISWIWNHTIIRRNPQHNLR